MCVCVGRCEEGKGCVCVCKYGCDCERVGAVVCGCVGVIALVRKGVCQWGSLDCCCNVCVWGEKGGGLRR